MRLFARECSMTALTYFRQPQCVTEDMIKKMALERGLPEERRSSTNPSETRPWSCFQVLPTGMRRRLQEYEDAAMRGGCVSSVWRLLRGGKG